jgi:hypothetical protein
VLSNNVVAQGFYEQLGWAADGAKKTEEWQGTLFNEVRYRISLSERI